MKTVKILIIGVVLALSFQSAFAWRDYGPFKGKPSIYQIASTYRLPSVSNNEMVQAIAKLNPNSFDSKGHLNTIKKVKIPTSVKEVHALIALKHPKSAIKNSHDEGSARQQFQAAQTQIQILSGQLNDAKAQISTLQAQQESGSFPWGTLWFVLWLATASILVLKLWTGKKTPQAVEQQPEINEELEEGVPENPEPSFAHNVYSDHHEIEQVELDIAFNEADVETPIDQSVSSYEQDELDPDILNEKEALLEAIEADPQDLVLRFQLLELYARLSDKEGFNHQSHEMTQYELMNEGDDVWSQVRALYLNKWVYA